MISEKLLQECLDEYKAVWKKKAALFDGKGDLLAASDRGKDGLWARKKVRPFSKEWERFLGESFAGWEIEEASLFPGRWKNGEGWIFLAEGTAEENRAAVLMTAGQLRRLDDVLNKKKSKKQVLKELLEGQLSGDEDECRLLSGFGKQKDENRQEFFLFLIEWNKEPEENIERVLAELFPGEKGAESVRVGKRQVAFLWPVIGKEGDADKTAAVISDTISGELMVKVYVSVGLKFQGISGLAKAYEEARTAMEIGKIFYTSRSAFSFSWLGIGRLIYGLPVSLCQRFVEDVFKKKTIPHIDKELLDTAYRFLGNNLNLSETGRQMYIHRNTLVYRLEKLHKETGLDIRNFDEALLFKIGMMIGEYMKYKKEGV